MSPETMVTSNPAADAQKMVPAPTLIDRDELEIHRLYRERIVQEDNIINHRMMWMIVSQAFLLATFVALSQKVDLFAATRVVCVTGIVLAFGSKFAIRAAQDEIDELRAKYIQMYPPGKEGKRLSRHVEFWMNLVDLRLSKQTEEYTHVFRLAGSGSHYLPGLTGSRNFHIFGHIVPKTVPLMLMVLWVVFFFTVNRDITHLPYLDQPADFG